MNLTLLPKMRYGKISIPASKSYAHRLLICSALSENYSEIFCDGISKDIEATVRCLVALGAKIENENGLFKITPIKEVPKTADLFCGESGSTLRFLVPVVSALGVNGVFHMEGKLPLRPITPLTDELTKHGAKFEQKGDLLYCSGKISAGDYEIPGNISSQYISGLLFALPLLNGDCRLTVTEKIESGDYILMTEDVLRYTKIDLQKKENEYFIKSGQKFNAPQKAQVEKDWSNAAFFASLGALSSSGVTLLDMPLDSKQGDREILNVLEGFGANITKRGTDITIKKGELHGQVVDAAKIPDLIPTICVVASVCEGETRIINGERLRIKESDRIKTTADMIRNLGGDIKETDDGMIIVGKKALVGGVADAQNDHRIAMSTAVASTVCENEVTLLGAECVAKSYPKFWNDFESLEVSK